MIVLNSSPSVFLIQSDAPRPRVNDLVPNPWLAFTLGNQGPQPLSDLNESPVTPQWQYPMIARLSPQPHGQHLWKLSMPQLEQRSLESVATPDSSRPKTYAKMRFQERSNKFLRDSNKKPMALHASSRNDTSCSEEPSPFIALATPALGSNTAELSTAQDTSTLLVDREIFSPRYNWKATSAQVGSHATIASASDKNATQSLLCTAIIRIQLLYRSTAVCQLLLVSRSTNKTSSLPDYTRISPQCPVLDPPCRQLALPPARNLSAWKPRCLTPRNDLKFKELSIAQADRSIKIRLYQWDSWPHTDCQQSHEMNSDPNASATQHVSTMSTFASLVSSKTTFSNGFERSRRNYTNEESSQTEDSSSRPSYVFEDSAYSLSLPQHSTSTTSALQAVAIQDKVLTTVEITAGVLPATTRLTKNSALQGLTNSSVSNRLYSQLSHNTLSVRLAMDLNSPLLKKRACHQDLPFRASTVTTQHGRPCGIGTPYLQNSRTGSRLTITGVDSCPSPAYGTTESWAESNPQGLQKLSNSRRAAKPRADTNLSRTEEKLQPYKLPTPAN